MALFLLAGEVERTVVGGDDLEVVGAQRPPQGLLVPFPAGPQRGGADVLGALEAGAGEVVGGEEEVLGAGLAVDRQPLVPGRHQLLHGLSRRDVHHVQRRSGDAGELDGAVDGLGLQQGMADLAVPAGLGVAGGEGLGGEDVDGDAVLGVHHDQGAVVGGALQSAQDPSVVAVVDARVRHVQPEGGDALLHQQVRLPKGVVVHVGEDHVEGVVDCALSVGLGVPQVQSLAEAATAALDGEVDDGGGAAPGRRPGAGGEGVGGEGPVEREVQVGVDVDATGDDVPAAGVDDAVRRPALRAGAAVRGEGGDPRPLDQDVGVQLLGGGDDESAADDRTAHAPISFEVAPGRPRVRR